MLHYPTIPHSYSPVQVGMAVLQSPLDKQVMFGVPIKVYWLSHVNDICCPAKPVHGLQCPFGGAVILGQVAIVSIVKHLETT